MVLATGQSVNVNRLALIDVLKTNMAKHIEEYQQALVDYRAKVVKELSAALDRAQSGDFKKVVVSVTVPQSHEEDYKDIIEMLEVSVDETIHLDRSSFKAYYKDEWGWSNSFKTLTASLRA